MKRLFVTAIITFVAGLCLVPVMADAGSVAPSNLANMVVLGANGSGAVDRVVAAGTQGPVLLAHWPGQCSWRKKCVLWRNGHCVKRSWMKYCPYPPFWFDR